MLGTINEANRSNTMLVAHLKKKSKRIVDLFILVYFYYYESHTHLLKERYEKKKKNIAIQINILWLN